MLNHWSMPPGNPSGNVLATMRNGGEPSAAIETLNDLPAGSPLNSKTPEKTRGGLSSSNESGRTLENARTTVGSACPPFSDHLSSGALVTGRTPTHNRILPGGAYRGWATSCNL